jgi:hypothetical protein
MVPATVTLPDDVPRTIPMTDTLIPDREQAASELAGLRLRTDLFIDGDLPAGARWPPLRDREPGDRAVDHGGG